MIALIRRSCAKDLIVSIEDGLFAEDDGNGWAKMTAEMENRVQCGGDDIFGYQRRVCYRRTEKKNAPATRS